MDIPEYLHDRIQQNIAWEFEAIVANRAANEKRNHWAVVFGLVPKRDGNQWYVLLGEDIQAGISGWGDSPEEAIADFDKQIKLSAK